MNLSSESVLTKLVSIRMMLIVFVAVFAGSGTIIVASFSVFMLPMINTLQMSRTEISFAVTIVLWSSAIIGPLLAKLVDRFGVRKVLVPNTLLFGLAIISLALGGTSKWQLFLKYALVGIASPSMAGYAKILSLWYTKRRGIALATMAIGTAASVAVIPKAMQLFIAAYNWQTAYFFLGLVVILLAVPAVAMMSEPKFTSQVKENAPQKEHGFSVGAALMSPIFWRITFGLGLVTVCAQGIQTHLVPIIGDKRISSDIAVYLFPALSIGSLLGQLFGGYLLDRYNSVRIVLLLAISSFGGLVIFTYSNNIWLLFIACILLATGAFGETGMAPYLFTRYFGLGSFATIYATNFSISIVFLGLSPVISGGIYDLYGSYHLALLLYMFFLVVSTLLLFFLRQYTYDRYGNMSDDYSIVADAAV